MHTQTDLSYLQSNNDLNIFIFTGKVDTHNNLFNYISLPYSYPNGAASMVSSISLYTSPFVCLFVCFTLFQKGKENER